jgi:MFS family permease
LFFSILSIILPSVVCERENGSLTKGSPAERDGAIRVAGRIFGRAAEENRMLFFTMLIVSVLFLVSFFVPTTKQYWKVFVARVRSPILAALGIALVPATMAFVDILPRPMNDIAAGILGSLAIAFVMPFMTAGKILK